MEHPVDSFIDKVLEVYGEPLIDRDAIDADGYEMIRGELLIAVGMISVYRSKEKKPE